MPHAIVQALGNGRAGRNTTDSQGHYDISVPSGTYTLTVTPANPRCPPTTVTLTAGATLEHDIPCDTGIR